MNKTLILFLALMSGTTFATDIPRGTQIVATSDIQAVAGERSDLYSARGIGFDCDLLMIGSDEISKLTIHKNDEMEVLSSKSWNTDWDGHAIPHVDIEISSAELKAKKIRLMISCDGSVSSEAVIEINKETLSEKLKSSFELK